MKNPLFTDAVLSWPCPTPQSLCWVGTGANETTLVSALRCDRPRCPACGPRNMRIIVKRFQRQFEADQNAGRKVRYFFLTVSIRPAIGMLSTKTSFELLDGIAQAVRQAKAPQPLQGWNGTEISYIKLLHIKPNDTAHLHMLVCQRMNADGKFASRNIFRRRLEHYCDRHVRSKLGLRQRSRASREEPAVQVYFKPCRSITASLAYMLWDKGRPWQGDWRFPKGIPRVRMTPGFLTADQSREKRAASQVNLVQGTIDEIAAKFARTDTPVRCLGPARFSVVASQARIDRILSTITPAQLRLGVVPFDAPADAVYARLGFERQDEATPLTTDVAMGLGIENVADLNIQTVADLGTTIYPLDGTTWLPNHQWLPNYQFNRPAGAADRIGTPRGTDWMRPPGAGP